MDTVQDHDDRSPFFAAVGGHALPFGTTASVRRGAAISAAKRAPRTLAAVSDDDLRAELRAAGQRTVAERNGVSRRVLYAEIVRRWGKGAGLSLRRESVLDMRDPAIAERLAQPPKPAAPRGSLPLAPIAAPPAETLPVPVRNRDEVRSFVNWTGTEWLDWFASAPQEAQRRFIEYGTAVLNSPIANAVPVPDLGLPVPGSHDHGENNVDIRQGKPKRAPTAPFARNRQP